MNRLLVAIVLSAASVPAMAGPGSAAPAAAPAKAGPGTTVVKQANDAISAALKVKAAPGSAAEKAQAQQVTASLRGFLDIDELGKRAMADSWSKLSKAQQTEFLDTLRSLIEDNYVRGLRSNLAYEVVYSGEKVDGANTTVTTEVKAQRKGRPFKIEIDYVLVSDGGKYRCWDIVTDGASLVDNYRAMFNKIIAKDGVPGLLEKMKKKLAGP